MDDDEDGVNATLHEIALEVEEHEAAVWIDCVQAAAALSGDPVGAVIDRTGALPLTALKAVDGPNLNRVVALGLRTPVRAVDLDAIWAFYAANGRKSFRIDVTPFSRPRDLAASLIARGMTCQSPGTFKIWRPVDPPLESHTGIDVRRLGSADIDAIADLNVVAWGAWSNPPLRAWFGATVGRAGAQHYGVFDADRLVATGALFVGDGLGWFGFDATHPRFQGRKLRQAISAVRLADAAAQGCRVVHAESAIPLRPRVFKDGWQSLYERQTYVTGAGNTSG